MKKNRKEKIWEFCLLNKQKSILVYPVEKCVVIKNLRFIAKKRKMKGRILLRHGNRYSEINKYLKFSKKWGYLFACNKKFGENILKFKK